ncbi:hypothetical protein GQX73_g9089 [Xylaria multiplex]|uniref:Uncharacterized protein n=1 Tax=Xylaria multiplex TaxID=323545 RepID=A0A7C8III5_9PEZI|nr:hypothetical protein GQX73_g9089 [Xylaria multiplex]
MFASSESLYPLAKVSRNDFAKLCEALWEWWPCADWTAERACQHSNKDPECHYQDAERLTPFFDFYRDATAYYVPELTKGSAQAIKTHDDLVRIIRYIKCHSNSPRLLLMTEYFASCRRAEYQDLLSSDQNRAFSLAARVMTMLQCSVEDQSDGLLEAGTLPAIWHSNKSFNQFIASVIERHNTIRLEPYGIAVPRPLQPAFSLDSISAKRLRNVAKLKIIPTNDLRGHLTLDKKNGTVEVYHYASVLKEHLKASRARELRADSGLPDQRYSHLPKQLILETLHTLKFALFPIDSESQSILRSLVAKDKFDPENCRVNASWQLREEELTAYEYWGSRVMDLYDELENPTPRGFVEKWMERKSGARYIMMATLAGVLIAILLGILTLAVSIIQTWIAWQQWQHPVS